MNELKRKVKHYLFPHSGMEKVMIHDDCGGWIAEIEYVCAIHLKCFKCGQEWEGYWRSMGDQPRYHYEWKPQEEVKKFYGELK